MNIKFGKLWECFAEYPSIFKYRLIKSSKSGELWAVEQLDKFAEEHKDDEVTDLLFYPHNGGIGLTVYLREAQDNA